MKRDEVRRLRASSQRSTRVASELLPGPLGVTARSWLIDRLTPATKSEARCRKDVANEHALPASRLREARFGGRSKAGLQLRVWPSGARRDPKRIVDTKRFALFGAPSRFI
jgi:hypothetical protein